MAKRQPSSVLNRLAGKKLVFSGKFQYGVAERLKMMAEAQQGTVLDDLTNKVDYLVLADLTAGKTIQKKAMALNGKGAAIQAIDIGDFEKLVEPTDDEILSLLHAGESDAFVKIHHSVVNAASPKYTFHSEDFRESKLQDVVLHDIMFDGCNFSGAELSRVSIGCVRSSSLGIGGAIDCDFSRVAGDSIYFGNIQRSRFTEAKLNLAEFQGDFSGADFTGAALEGASFHDFVYYKRANFKTPLLGAIFTKSNLKSARFNELHLKSPDFAGADLSAAEFHQCAIEAGRFCNATLRKAVLIGCKLTGADFSNADLTGANLGDADLTGARIAGTCLKKVNLRGAKLDGVDLALAKNYEPSEAVSGAVGPALTEIDSVKAKAKHLQVTFQLCATDEDEGEEVGIDSSGLMHGWGIRLPKSIAAGQMFRSGGTLAFSDAMLHLANFLGNRQVRFETVDVSSTKSPMTGRALRDLVIRGIAEAFAQDIPAEDVLAAATKAYRDAEREKGAAEREKREQAKAAAAKQKEKAKKQIAKKVEKAVGKVTDIATFLKALEVRIEKPKIDKATKMLKASGFKLFNDITDEHVSGVVKSQTDADLVYACRVDHEGQYSCCTQNLNVCGGLRGSICKHLLVLIIGLVQAGELDPTTIDAWIAKTHHAKPLLDKENMGAIFIKYKGAEAGEVDWRPTETVPEDYYAL